MAENELVADTLETTADEKASRNLTKRQRLVVTVASALVVAVAFQLMTIVRNNYPTWDFTFMAIEWVVALVASFAANGVHGMEERGRAWAANWIPSQTGLAYRVMAALPSAAVRAAILTACLSIPNATYVPMVIYRETVALPPLAVLIRFLSDIPQAVTICLLVQLLVRRFVTSE